MNINEYRKRYVTPSVNIIAKTGCPYNCTYCDAKTVNGDKFIFRNPEAIVDDAKKIIKIMALKHFFIRSKFQFTAGLGKGSIKRNS